MTKRKQPHELKQIGVIDPTPRQIARATARIRRNWSSEVHALRAGTIPRPLSVDVIGSGKFWNGEVHEAR